ncbi:diguanylate cyclase domain-containing protein [Halomonas lysinitropha]
MSGSRTDLRLFLFRGVLILPGLGRGDVVTDLSVAEGHAMARLSGSMATASVGVASYPEHGALVEALLDRADNAMYVSKASGGNRVSGQAVA